MSIASVIASYRALWRSIVLLFELFWDFLFVLGYHSLSCCLDSLLPQASWFASSVLFSLVCVLELGWKW